MARTPLAHRPVSGSSFGKRQGEPCTWTRSENPDGFDEFIAAAQTVEGVGLESIRGTRDGWLAGDSKLRAHARLWRDRLNPGGREYLHSGPADRMLADQRTPTVAREWGVLVNMSEEKLRAFFGKHVA